MENMSTTDSKCCEIKKNTYFKSAIRLSSLITIYNYFRLKGNNEAKTPDALGSAAHFIRLVQSSLGHFNFNCLYFDCINDWEVYVVNRSIANVIRLKNIYKIKKMFPYASLPNLKTNQSAIQLYLAVFSGG
jgi:hypothetical protein